MKNSVAIVLLGFWILSFSWIHPLGHHGPIVSVGMSVDGRIAASGGAWPDPTVRIWDLGTGEVLNTLGFGNRYNVVAVSQDGRYVVIGGDTKAIVLWNVIENRVERFYLGHTKPITAVAMEPLGMYIASGDESGTVKIWKLGGRGLYKNFFAHKYRVTDLSFSQDGQFLASSSVDGTVIIWKGFYRYPIKTVKTGAPVMSVCVISAGSGVDGTVLLVTGDSRGKLTFWRLTPEVGEYKILVPYRLEELKSVKAHSGAILDIAVSPDGSNLVSVGEDGVVKVWSMDNMEAVRVLGKTGVPLSAVSLTLDGRVLVADSGGNLRLWDSNSGMMVRIFEGSPMVTDVDLHGELLAVGYRDGTVKVFDREGKLLGVLREHRTGVVRVAVTGSGIVSAGDDGKIVSYRMEPFEVRRVLIRQGKAICCLAKDPKTDRVVTVDEMGNMSVWNVGTGTLDLFISTGEKVRSVAISGDIVLTGTGLGKLAVWSIKERREVREIDLKVPIRILGIDDTGNRLAVFCDDGYVRVMDMDDLKTIASIRPLSRTVTDLVLSGEKLYVVGGEDTVEVWNVRSGEPEPGIIVEDDSLFSIAVDGSGTVYAGGYTGTIYAGSGAELRQFIGFADGEYAIFTGGKLITSKGLESGIAVGIEMKGRKREDGKTSCPTLPKGSRITMEFKGAGLKLSGADLWKDTVYLISEDGRILVWGLKGGKIFKTVEISKYPLTAVDVDGEGILVGDKKGNVFLVSFDGDVKKIGRHFGAVKGVGWFGKHPVSVGVDGYLKIWGNAERDVYVKNPYSLHVSGRLAVVGGNESVSIVDLEKGEVLDSKKVHSDIVIAVTGDGKKIFSSGMDGTLAMWDVESGNTVVIEKSLMNHTSLSVSDGLLVAGSILGELDFFDTDKLERIGKIKLWDFPVVSITPLGKKLIVVGEGGIVTLLDEKGKKVAELFVKDGGYLVYTSNGEVLVENVDIGKIARVYLEEDGKRRSISPGDLCQTLGIDLTR